MNLKKYNSIKSGMNGLEKKKQNKPVSWPSLNYLPTIWPYLKHVVWNKVK